MATFDAPNREVCTLRRPRSNTPLQALVTLNDPVYVEAAQALAGLMARHEGSCADKATFGFQTCLSRPPREAELKRLIHFFETSRAEYAGEPENALKMATEPRGPVPEGSDVIDVAAWTTVANVLLNLDEMLMKP